MASNKDKKDLKKRIKAVSRAKDTAEYIVDSTGESLNLSKKNVQSYIATKRAEESALFRIFFYLCNFAVFTLGVSILWGLVSLNIFKPTSAVVRFIFLLLLIPQAMLYYHVFITRILRVSADLSNLGRTEAADGNDVASFLRVSKRLMLTLFVMNIGLRLGSQIDRYLFFAGVESRYVEAERVIKGYAGEVFKLAQDEELISEEFLTSSGEKLFNKKFINSVYEKSLIMAEERYKELNSSSTNPEEFELNVNRSRKRFRSDWAILLRKGDSFGVNLKAKYMFAFLLLLVANFLGWSISHFLLVYFPLNKIRVMTTDKSIDWYELSSSTQEEIREALKEKLFDQKILARKSFFWSWLTYENYFYIVIIASLLLAMTDIMLLT